MAAEILEFHPVAAEWSAICRELEAKAEAVELLMGLRAGFHPLTRERLYLCSEGRDLLGSIEAYLLWRHASLSRELGTHCVGVRL
jgi:hypothetical protein